LSSSVIIGRSEFGKSSLAKALARRFTRHDERRVLVYDILSDRWDSTLTVDNEEEFLKIYWGSFDIIAIVDECGVTATIAKPKMAPIARRGRHQVGPKKLGNSNYFIAHRLTDLDPNIRAQCSELYLFACRYDDAKDFALEHGAPVLKTASTLPPGQFFHVAPGKPVTRWKIDFSNLKIRRLYA